MDTYKVGNKAKCIIRSYAPGKLGDEVMQYGNQPYTILKDVGVTINFDSSHISSKVQTGNLYGYDIDYVGSLAINNVPLTDKIVKLIYDESNVSLCSVAENCTSDEDGKVFLNCGEDEIYQVFIYDDTGKLERAEGFYNITRGITVKNPNSSYLICYSFIGGISVDLNRNRSKYVTLDFELPINCNDTTSRAWIHIDKCCLSISKNLNLAQEINTVTLTCDVINDTPDEEGKVLNYMTFCK